MFRAYENVENSNKGTELESQWLENSSFKPELDSPPDSSLESKKPEIDSKVFDSHQITSPNDLFIVDTKGDDRLLDIDTLRGHAVPRYNRPSRPSLGLSKSKKKSKRYSKSKIVEPKSSEFTLHEEDKLLKNRLANNENDIELWKEFIKAQERGLAVNNVKAITERQISIIDEALLKNPNNADLYEMWFYYNKKIYPYDEFANTIINRTQQDSGNYLLWKGLLDYTQQSVSECNVTVILELHRKAITSFKKFRNQNILNKGVLFKLFQRVSLFLRQTGSWKELMYLLEYTIWLNCSDIEITDIFKFPRMSQSNLIELEEAVLQSGLPLSEIWFRIESLRETFNWSTVDNSFKNIECALTIEELDDLTTVFTKETSKFDLMMYLLTVLRVPILPSRQTLNNLLGINEIAWHYDSSESVLTLFYETDFGSNTEILQVIYNILVHIADGPQYWGPRPFTSDYYEFVLSLIKNSMDYSNDDEAKLAFGLLYIRFIKLHYTLWNYSKKPINNKSIKKRLKQMLSENTHLKSSILLYIEYAKVELTISGLDSAINTLKVLLESVDTKHHDYLYLLRTYISFELEKNNEEMDKTKLINLLYHLVDDGNYSESKLHIAIEKFHCSPYSEEISSLSPSILKPNSLENWLCCGAYFIYFTEGLEKAVLFLKIASEKVDPFVKEGLFEWFASFAYDIRNIKIIQDVLKDGVNEYPNNSTLLFAFLHICSQWVKVKPILVKSPIGIVILASFARLQAEKISENSDKVAYKNRELSILNDATSDPVLQQHPFLWKLYLQILYEYGSDKIMDVMTQALEKFPWLKALYVSGVRYAPQEHSSFQDIIAEKELALLALPEELEILREDNPD